MCYVMFLKKVYEMNAVLILWIFIIFFFIWVMSALLFPIIGDFVKTIIKWMKEKDEDE